MTMKKKLLDGLVYIEFNTIFQFHQNQQLDFKPECP